MKSSGPSASRLEHGEDLTNDDQKAYEAPVLVFYGDVRDITLGPTLGAGESGCEAIFRPGPGGCP
jgi:hypothetical protein